MLLSNSLKKDRDFWPSEASKFQKNCLSFRWHTMFMRRCLQTRPQSYRDRLFANELWWGTNVDWFLKSLWQEQTTKRSCFSIFDGESIEAATMICMIYSWLHSNKNRRQIVCDMTKTQKLEQHTHTHTCTYTNSFQRI